MKKLSYKLNTHISYELLILGSENLEQNNTFSILLYQIYKKFLYDNDSSNTQKYILTNFIKKELQYKTIIYNMTTRTSELIIPLQKVLDILL